MTGQIHSQFLRPDPSLRQVGFQEADIVGMAKPVTKYAIMITDPNSIRYELEKALKEIKQLKIQVHKEHEGFQLEKLRNQGLQNQIKDIIVENEEICSEKKQTEEYIEEINKQLNVLKDFNKQLTDKLKQYDTITQNMMKLGGYEFE